MPREELFRRRIARTRLAVRSLMARRSARIARTRPGIAHLTYAMARNLAKSRKLVINSLEKNQMIRTPTALTFDELRLAGLLHRDMPVTLADPRTLADMVILADRLAAAAGIDLAAAIRARFDPQPVPPAVRSRDRHSGNRPHAGMDGDLGKLQAGAPSPLDGKR